MVLFSVECVDGRVVHVDSKVTEISPTFAALCKPLENEGEKSIPTLMIDSETFEKVIQWAKHHFMENHTKEDKNGQVEEQGPPPVSDWDRNFFADLKAKEMIRLMLAARYLDLKTLIDLSNRSIANLIKGKTPEEIRETFNIQNDLTEEEEEQIRKDNQLSIN